MKIRFALLLVSLCGVTACRARETLFDAGRKFASLDGTVAFSLDNVAPGVRHVVVNFFAPDCPPCEKEVPALRSFSQVHEKNPAVRFVSIGSSLRAVGAKSSAAPGVPGDAEMTSEIRTFTKKFKIAYPQYLARVEDLAAWKVTGFPETFVFARSEKGWTLRRKFISEVTQENLENELK